MKKILQRCIILLLALFTISCQQQEQADDKKKQEKTYENSYQAPSPKTSPKQTQTIQAGKKEIVMGDKGSLYLIEKNTFVDSAGNPVHGEVTVELREMVQIQDYIRSGLETMAGDKLLISDGAYYFNATQNGQQLQIARGKSVYASFPTPDKDPDMQFFTGEEDEQGNVNWQLEEGKDEKPMRNPMPDGLNSYNECVKVLEIIENNYQLKGDTYHAENRTYKGFNTLKKWYVDKLRALKEYYANQDELKQYLARRARRDSIRARRDSIRASNLGLNSYEYRLTRMGWKNIDDFPRRRLANFKGRLLLPNKKPAKDTRVHVFSTNPRFHRKLFTGPNGFYSFKFIKGEDLMVLGVRNKNCRGFKKYTLKKDDQDFGKLIMQEGKNLQFLADSMLNAPPETGQTAEL